MSRSYRRKKEKKDPAAMENAVAAVRNGANVRTVARTFNVPRGSLQYRLKHPLKAKRANQVI